jgi:hypothetical protein
LNISEDEELFKEYIPAKYKTVDVNICGVLNYTNYKICFKGLQIKNSDDGENSHRIVLCTISSVICIGEK